jgi:hypothetical protein
MHLTLRHRLAMNKAILINTGMHIIAVGRFLAAPAVLLHMPTRFHVLRRLSVHTLAQTRLRCFNRCRTNDIDLISRHDDRLVHLASVFVNAHSAWKSGSSAAPWAIHIMTRWGRGAEPDHCPDIRRVQLHMDGSAIDSQRCFLDRFVEGGVPVANARDVFRRSAEFHDRHDFMDQTAGVRANYMRP